MGNGVELGICTYSVEMKAGRWRFPHGTTVTGCMLLAMAQCLHKSGVDWCSDTCQEND